MNIGEKLKNLRQSKNLTQEELADRCELTKGYISQLENDLTSPSIESLKDLLNALGTTFGEFFEDDEIQIVFKKNEHIVKDMGTTKIKWLVPTSQKNSMEPIIMEIAPNSKTEKDLPHDGEEFGIVLVGKIKIYVGKKEFLASQGESFYFSANKPHFLENLWDKTSKILWVSCPPNF